MESISVALRAEVVDVTGSINGVVVDFVLTSPQIWTAEVTTAGDGKYVINITTLNQFEEYNNYTLTAYQFTGWIPPIYDRAQWDLDSGNSRGYLNYHDLNRIEHNCRFLADTLAVHGYSISIDTKTDWERTDFPYVEELERISSNISILAAGFYTLPTTPALPTNLEVMYYYKLNDTEKILADIKLLFDSMLQSVRYSGTFFSGGVNYGIGSN